MSLFHSALHLKPVYEEAINGRGFFFGPSDLLKLFKGGKPTIRKEDYSSLPTRWCIIDERVIDLDLLASGAAEEHPGGQAALKLAEGRDATMLFRSTHALARKEMLSYWLKKCTVGSLAEFPEASKALAASGAEGSFSPTDSPFAAELTGAARAYFERLAAERGVTVRQALKAPLWKWALIAFLWAVYIFSFYHWIQGAYLGLLLLPWVGALATFHTFHDASHGALSTKAWVNELLTFSGFLIGAPHEWYWQHVACHHVWTNIADADPDAKHVRRWVRPGKFPPPLAVVPVLWAIAVPIGLQVLYSYRYLNAAFGLSLKKDVPPEVTGTSLLALVLQRLIFYVWPVWRFGFSGVFWAAYPAAVFSLLFMLNTQLAHLNHTTDGEADDVASECWYKHQLTHSVDFAVRSPLHWFMSGGLNLQSVHHCFPTVDHSHLPQLRRVMLKVCHKHGVQMHTFDSYSMGVVSHLQHLATGASERPMAQQVPSSQAALSAHDASVGVPGEGAAKPASGMPNGAQATPNGHDQAGKASAGTAGESAEGKPRVCVVGSGIAGNAAAYMLRHEYDVVLCEKDDRPGGHAHTIAAGSEKQRVDIGFQVFNFSNYPLLSKLFDELGVETIQSDMSLSVAARGVTDVQDFEWSSKSLFPTWSDVFSLRGWRRLYEILCFERAAHAALHVHPETLGDQTMKSWLLSQGFSQQLIDEYIAPMGAALWSCSMDECTAFPACIVLGFLDNHFMLQRARPKWRTPKYRAEDYVRKLHAALAAAGGQVCSGTDVAKLELAPEGRGIRVVTSNGQYVSAASPVFDKVVLAVHADQASIILAKSNLSGEDRKLCEETIDNFKYSSNAVYIHTDPKYMPKKKACWSAWNGLNLPGAPAVVTYWINKLQPGACTEGKDVFVTLNPPEGSIDQTLVLAKYTLDHPLLDEKALIVQRALPRLQGLGGRIYFCGAWAGWGFHEDGMRSARAACQAMGVDMTAWPAGRRPLASMSWAAKKLWDLALLPGLQQMISKGVLRVVFGDGGESILGDGKGTAVELRVRSERFLWRSMLDPGMALANAFEAGEIEVRPDIANLFQLMLENKPKGDNRYSPMSWSPVRFLSPLAKRYQAMMHASRANSTTGSEKNIEAHYDLSNQMFSLFLSNDMTYSSGIFDKDVQALQASAPLPERLPGGEDFLELAQRRKMDRLLDLIELEPGDQVLEVGGGWGSLAIRAAQRCPELAGWTAITLSRQQLELANQRVAEAGVGDKVSVIFCDYRDVVGRFGAGYFSKAVSVEMIEAVGHEYLPVYFGALDQCLKPGGKLAIQAICVPDERYESYRNGSDFIREKIFPGSHLPCLAEIHRSCYQLSLRECAAPFSLGLSYAATLKEWRRRFTVNEPQIRQLVSSRSGEGFDDSFVRRWNYYFAYCETGFREKHIDVWQLCFLKDVSLAERVTGLELEVVPGRCG
ncbi:ufaA1 [Symbiodinium natans]|uniref:UfaA1 protein n=1 Tax=Symbiodinium natans TaxID=878477 RepID=A0A812P3L4_9DINO|nr:ufaA1 [Symbiodinium natans]